MSPAACRMVLAIMGMRDNACRERVSDAIGRIRGVRDVSVSLIRAKAVVTYEAPCVPAELVWAVVNAGYGASMD